MTQDAVNQGTGRTDEVRGARSHSFVFTVDSFADGIAFGQHRAGEDDESAGHYDLRIGPEGEVAKLRSRYTLNPTNPLWELERHLMRLSRQGVLGSSTIYFGTSTDPFFPFEGKFDASMKFLALFERYTPGLLVVQTRSPLLVIAMPVLKKLGDRAAVTLAVETHLEDMVRLYTPGFTRVDERLRAATALRRFGVEVTLQVAPVLPYGDWRRDADAFAEVLDQHGDRVVVRSLNRGTPDCEKRIRHSSVAKRLAQERKFQWLRPDAATPLLNALDARCPKKLASRPMPKAQTRQMSIFAA
jgi:DNA repair photolyase